jgi:hypothetical protein
VPEQTLGVGRLLPQRSGMVLRRLACLTEHCFANPIPALPSP